MMQHSASQGPSNATFGTKSAYSWLSMFIIARHRGQKIAIGDEIEVTITEISKYSQARDSGSQIVPNHPQRVEGKRGASQSRSNAH